MKTIKIQNVTQEEIHVLQNELHEYQNSLASNLRSQSDFLNAIIYVDLALRLWFNFRNKIENQEPKKGYSITLKASEAAVLLKVCLWQNKSNATFERHVKTKYSFTLDQQLKSLQL
ncbi:hypothetical protein [Flavobacterium sp. NRK F7]|uniref:hypothetical protein n=1 Tax=Flavobacterium sp. NRK F7 TaxID=2954930 RepID=UPI00209025FC|nr:hypothetical protein [Flavobacterium sp. NRK F7]MCO6162580.1 hypothetical protein [Flavobacterium sp. NRK F7]